MIDVVELAFRTDSGRMELVTAELRFLGQGVNRCRIDLRRELGFGSEFDGPDFFEALRVMRLAAEPSGWMVLCAGARRDVWCTGMSRSMGLGCTAYVLRPGRPVRRADLVGIFEAASPDSVCGIVEQERAFQLRVSS